MADRSSIERTDATRCYGDSSGRRSDDPSCGAYPAAVRPSLTAIDVFAGAGGLSLGFEQAGFVPVLGVDSDARAMMAYATNFPGTSLVADVGSISGWRSVGRLRLGVMHRSDRWPPLRCVLRRRPRSTRRRAPRAGCGIRSHHSRGEPALFRNGERSRNPLVGIS